MSGLLVVVLGLWGGIRRGEQRRAARFHLGDVGNPWDMHRSGTSVSLTIPVEGFVEVARRVLAGAAGMADLGFEAVDDLQLALEIVLRSGVVVGESATITIADGPTGLTVRVGEVDATLARRRLRAEPGSRMALGDVLERIVDEVGVTRGSLPELVLHKTLSRRAA
jgi:hypothetical protein